MKVDGACHCGAITVVGEIDPGQVVICHCTDCQTGTGSAFRVSVPIPGKKFTVTGKPATHLKTTADSGNRRVHAFCPTCGTPIYSTTVGNGPQDRYMLRVGILRQRRELQPRNQIWFRSAQSWVTDIGSIPKTDKEPPP
jgi:hypothetical protein